MLSASSSSASCSKSCRGWLGLGTIRSRRISLVCTFGAARAVAVVTALASYRRFGIRTHVVSAIRIPCPSV